MAGRQIRPQRSWGRDLVSTAGGSRDGLTEQSAVQTTLREEIVVRNLRAVKLVTPQELFSGSRQKAAGFPIRRRLSGKTLRSCRIGIYLPAFPWPL